MSSLNATQADGYYAPPEYYESGAYKKQSISQFAGSKGHNQYLQRSVVRFELPYDGFCCKCSGHVGKGTRFNAHKAHVDNYFTTKIWEFTTKCRLCAESTFMIRTNPKERSFDYVEGIRKKVEEFDTQQAGTIGVVDTDLGSGIVPSSGPDTGSSNHAAGADVDNDSLSRLERSAVGERKAEMEFGRLESIQRLNDATSKDDAASNGVLRAKYRKERQGRKRRLGEAVKIGLGHNIELAEPVEEDTAVSREAFAESKATDKRARKRETEAFKTVRSGSIFGAKTSRSKGRKKDSQSKLGRSGLDGGIRSSEVSQRKQQDFMCSDGTCNNQSSRSSIRRKRILFKPPLLHQEQKPSAALIGNIRESSGSSTSREESNSSDQGGPEAQQGSSAQLKEEMTSSALSALAAYGSESESD